MVIVMVGLMSSDPTWLAAEESGADGFEVWIIDQVAGLPALGCRVAWMMLPGERSIGSAHLLLGSASWWEEAG